MTARSAPDWLTRWEYAHRGLHGAGRPENSLAAAEAAIEAGMGIECDIQRSKDGEAMVFHDWELERLTDGAGATGELSAEALGRLSLRENAEPVPTLKALLDLIAGRVPLLVEIKSKPGYDVVPSCERVCGLLSDYSGEAAVMSFDPRVAEWVREYAPHLPCGLVMREDRHGYTQTAAERGEALRAAEPDFLAYHVLALPNERVTALRAGGLPILTWTVNSPETRATAKAHADALVSEGEGLG
ncbi:glycerophosphodiester phosphodiesterase family protein [uncultured Erythrobacter sp.]|uniref:glycerophosphodiester phosphodiesterase family protein n=1 Tax=uncultured Erythrobacter sp. TaxID=263913 RepID=UPI002630913D|nr:glycerophosphodiester phosphodiesterase family protein [uncultured Erythrobacter sp.]